MKLYGLTGGIATGKSTVTAMFRALGLPVIDADQLAREVVEPGQPALAEIAARFPGVLGADGRLDRKKLGERIFQDPAERAALNAITHPRIRELALTRTVELAATGAPVALYDAPLLIENRLHEGMNGVILVWCPREVQLERLRARDGLTLEQAEARLASQLPIDDKRAFATWIIDNGGTLEATRAQVERISREL
ncbi:MAG: dephospho-CoA kinase [Myxococcota bacterium]